MSFCGVLAIVKESLRGLCDPRNWPLDFPLRRLINNFLEVAIKYEQQQNKANHIVCLMPNTKINLYELISVTDFLKTEIKKIH